MSPVPKPFVDSLVIRTTPRIRVAGLREYIDDVTRLVLRGRGFSCLLTDDGEIRRLNRQFRKKDSATDVLSFPAAVATEVSGDIAVSVDRARAQAAEHGHSLAEELRILILHGALHLRGMDHETDAGQMARAEARWRKRFELPLSLLERIQ
jgi:probable rRNA maturation factor